MPISDLSHGRHHHDYWTDSTAAERGTRLVLGITAAAMVVEILAGWFYNSMALLADGWHMSSHALAIGLSVLAYAAARRYASDPRFSFGTWRIEVLSSFASAVLLVGVAVMMVIGSIERLLTPEPIRYLEAMAVAVLGLGVNVVCAFILGKAQRHGHGHAGQPGQHGHGHAHPHAHDLNLRSAYLHVIADAATSVLAIIALFGGWRFGWGWLDPVMGIVGAVLVAIWAKGLILDTANVLLDREMDHPVVDEIRDVVEFSSDAGTIRLTDLHVWRVGRAAYACALSVVTDDASLTPTELRRRLSIHEEVVHTTIEIHLHTDRHASAGAAT